MKILQENKHKSLYTPYKELKEDCIMMNKDIEEGKNSVSFEIHQLHPLIDLATSWTWNQQVF